MVLNNERSIYSCSPRQSSGSNSTISVDNEGNNSDNTHIEKLKKNSLILDIPKYQYTHPSTHEPDKTACYRTTTKSNENITTPPPILMNSNSTFRSSIMNGLLSPESPISNTSSISFNSSFSSSSSSFHKKNYYIHNDFEDEDYFCDRSLTLKRLSANGSHQATVKSNLVNNRYSLTASSSHGNSGFNLTPISIQNEAFLDFSSGLDVDPPSVESSHDIPSMTNNSKETNVVYDQHIDLKHQLSQFRFKRDGVNTIQGSTHHDPVIDETEDNEETLRDIDVTKILQWFCCECGNCFGNIDSLLLTDDNNISEIPPHMNVGNNNSSDNPAHDNAEHEERFHGASKNHRSYEVCENQKLVKAIKGYEINRFDCNRCLHMMCPYCIKFRVDDLLKREEMMK